MEHEITSEQTILKAYGKKLKVARTELDMTQEQAAKAIGVSIASWQRWESGSSEPLRVFKTTIESYFGVSFENKKGEK